MTEAKEKYVSCPVCHSWPLLAEHFQNPWWRRLLRLKPKYIG